MPCSCPTRSTRVRVSTRIWSTRLDASLLATAKLQARAGYSVQFWISHRTLYGLAP
ncbi:hypothetical protein PPTG_16225 [Phytophthora nicotianae INRA-310]|uniref:Uncharacterized protein n=1 Tax=Phytophthora nicotianae (strain INRA-310) TaxID=761204 RepID=W2PNQ0_PHYN3|nr:hypothetical protein PPTG_16225 [Phytophthora nicotianae INRA-310]ETN02618.1 hypothetical protein PPTG_16225 [Phytophthora nicotianae INRA-310]